ncbi:MAG: YebC/PmpR family DNA-binding transcriptional regulator [Gammaproteobacteria bacterium]|nr:YebC/PmpR family DNA-binding transcriptional regulator [Gammaproteobacteria bacterium]MDH5803053.1 YebC/PmpR family DNA-binding transcriptional regulator [Gammaproteobacteria bacterium]
MAGHSKWHNIQHRKGAQDAKRGKLFTKLIREITVAARTGGGDASSNPRLRAAIDKALSANMTRDTVDRAIKRGSGQLDADSYEEILYEGYGVNGVAVLVECLTDNRNRTVAEVRHAFNKYGGNLGTSGSVAYLFSKVGLLSYACGDEDAIMEAALEVGAEDVVVNDDGSIDVLTSAEDFMVVKDAMVAANWPPQQADIIMQASIQVDLGLEDAQKFVKMVDLLEDLDDVQKVHTNADVSDAVMAQL